MSFPTYDAALQYVRTYGREWTRPCDMLKIVQQTRNEWKIMIEMKASRQFVGWVQ